jgi:streptogramin lyase
MLQLNGAKYAFRGTVAFPLIVLSACHTDQIGGQGKDAGDAASVVIKMDAARDTPADGTADQKGAGGSLGGAPYTFTEFSVPSSDTSPDGITVGADGNLWFAGGVVSDTTVGKITTTGTITLYSSYRFGGTHCIARGPDGNVWYTDDLDSYVGKVTPSGDFTEFPVPNTTGDQQSFPTGIVLGPDGNLWVSDRFNVLSSITPSGTFNGYLAAKTSYGLAGIVVGPDNNLWVKEDDGNSIARITPSGTLTEFRVPKPTDYTFWEDGPNDITLGPDGNLWFTEGNGNRIGRITPSGTITEFAIPTADSSPNSIAKGPDGNLWFTECRASQLARITPAGTITEYAVPTAKSCPSGIVAGPDGAIWFTEYSANKIGRMAL